MIPVYRIIEKLNECYGHSDMDEAKRLLKYWREEAVATGDRQGELSMVNEELGLYRKTKDEPEAMEAVERSLQLIEDMGLSDSVSGATIYLNAATTLKSFNRASEAIAIYEKAFAVYQDNLSMDDERMAGFYNNYGLALQDLARYEDAEMDFKFAAGIMKKHPEHIVYAGCSYVNLAELYQTWNEKTPEDSYESLRIAWEFLMADTNELSADYAFQLSKCADTYRYFGLMEEAQAIDRTVAKVRSII